MTKSGGRAGAPKQKWTAEEEQALRAGVEKFGVGKWRSIQKDDDLGSVLANRSNVDLKDKWRNLNMDSSGARGDKQRKSSAGRSKGFGSDGKLGGRRKRKRKQERASGAASPPTGLLVLQNAAMDLAREHRRPLKKPRHMVDYSNGSEDEDEDEEEDEEEDDEEEEEELEGDEEGEGPGEDGLRHEDGEGEVQRHEGDRRHLGPGPSNGHSRHSKPKDMAGPVPDDMVVAAIISLADPRGSSPSEIIDWIERHYERQVSPKFRTTVRKTLERMVLAKRLDAAPNHADRYLLGGIVGKMNADGGHQWPPLLREPDTAGREAQIRSDLEAGMTAIAQAEAAAHLAYKQMSSSWKVLAVVQPNGQTAAEAAEAAAKAVAEAEQAAETAQVLMEVANRYGGEGKPPVERTNSTNRS